MIFCANGSQFVLMDNLVYSRSLEGFNWKPVKKRCLTACNGLWAQYKQLAHIVHITGLDNVISAELSLGFPVFIKT